MTSLSYVIELPEDLDLDGIELWDIYARISDDPGNDELGVKRQVREATARIEARGGRVHAIRIDNNTSAWKRVKRADGTFTRVPSPRPEWEALQEDVNSGLVRNIMSREPSRLWRHWADLVPVCDWIETSGVNVDTLYGGRLDVSNAGDRAKTRMFGVVNALESEIKSERLQSKMLELAEDGKFAGGKRPFGFAANGIDPIEAEQAVIRAWADAILNGSSLRDLERLSVDTKTPSGKAWTFATIHQLLVSPRIAGLRQHQGNVIGKAAWLPVIEPAAWERVRAILTDPSRKHRTPVRYLLSGFLYAQRLDEDGNVIELPKMHGGRAVGPKGPDGKRIGSTAPDGYRRIYEVKPGGSIDAAKTEEAVELAILDATDRTAFLKPRGKRVEPDTSDVEQAQANVDYLKAQRKSGKLDLEDYVELMAECRQALKDAQAALVESTPVGPPPNVYRWLGRPGALRQAWTATDEDGNPVMTFDERREVLAYVLERVEVKPGRAGSRLWDPDRLSFRFRA
jgi:DNA invertase Pin-like site-specific DNA recombinase